MQLTSAPAVIKEVEYDRETKDFAAFITIDERREYIGSRRSYGEADRLCDEFAYNFYADNHTPEVAAAIAVRMGEDEETCPGIERPCGKPATCEYLSATGFDMETARSVSLWYCENCFAALVNWSESPVA